MSIDLSQFYEVFFEESFEGLDVMEAELLNLTPGSADSETINTIFRAAHSIKGGSGTFGFSDVSDFTHVLETLLDQIRDGQRELTQQHVDLLLLSVDCLRDLLSCLQSESEVDTTSSDALKAQFEAILEGKETSSAESSDDSQNTQSSAEISDPFSSGPTTKFWQIKFKPEPHLFKTGNEPLYLFQELADLGDLTVLAETDKLSEFHQHTADDCFLSWTLDLSGDISKEQINEVFEWVDTDADISIELIAEIDGDEPETEANPDSTESSSSEEISPAPVVESAEPSPVASPAVTAEPKSTKPAPAKAKEPKSQESTSIRVGIDKVDSLINIVGELVITQAMLSQLGESSIDDAKLMTLQEGLSQLAHNTRDLQESVMRIRMLPISFVFSRFPRVVRDTAQKLGKKVELKLIGEQTELDKTVMEKISDPMVHLVRNSLDHGLETPEERLAAGKGETGTVTLNAFHQGGNIIIEITDDGKGLNTAKIKEKAIENGMITEQDNLSDDEINLLIMQPGFSTADVVSDISGRGVGMDVVRRNIESLNGSIEVTSVAGQGSTFTIRLPLTLAILDGQLITVGQHTYIIPLISIIESLQVDMSKVNNVGGGLEVMRLRDEYIPIMRLYQLFNHEGAIETLQEGLLVVVESDNEKVGLLVDDLLAQQQVVIKSLEANYKKVQGISGATILGDGTVSLIVDITGLINLAGLKKPGRQGLAFDAPVAEVS